MKFNQSYKNVKIGIMQVGLYLKFNTRMVTGHILSVVLNNSIGFRSHLLGFILDKIIWHASSKSNWKCPYIQLKSHGKVSFFNSHTVNTALYNHLGRISLPAWLYNVLLTMVIEIYVGIKNIQNLNSSLRKGVFSWFRIYLEDKLLL